LTILSIDDSLLEEARVIGKHKTGKAAVTAALKEYIQRRKQMAITEIFGTIEYEESYDHKQQRRKK
jgi:predicted CopG family antitoxin